MTHPPERPRHENPLIMKDLVTGPFSKSLFLRWIGEAYGTAFSVGNLISFF